jgi:hypothetical protein
MPRRSRNAPPPWWLAPFKEWAREARLAMASNGHYADAEALRLLVRTRGEESARLKGLAQSSNTQFDADEASLARGDELPKLLRGFVMQGMPAPLPSANVGRPPLKPLPLDRPWLLAPALRVELERRAILDDLPDDKRRLICAAGEIIWVAYHAHRYGTRLERGWPHEFRDLGHPGDVVGRARIHDKGEAHAHALAAGAKIIGAMHALYGAPRYILTTTLVKFFTGEAVTRDELLEFGKQLTGSESPR